MPEPQQEGARWRYARPTSEEVAKWFEKVPLDEGMEHENYIGGVVLIPATEKVQKQVERSGRMVTEDSYELTYTPYVRVDTRVTYFRALAAARSQIAVIESVSVPQIADGPARNDNMPPGFWWHVVPTGSGDANVRFLCCTMRVALYREEDWLDLPRTVTGSNEEKLRVGDPRPVREGVATKQVPVALGQRGVDQNMLAKAETGAIGRALGIAGILVVGTGIATAEDLAELRETPAAAASLPEGAVEAPETPEQLNQRLLQLQAELQGSYPEMWKEIASWWDERKKAEGWANLDDAPIEVRRGMASRMELRLEAERNSSPPEPPAKSEHHAESGK